MQTEEVLDKLREYKAEKADAYGIEALGLFGSYARGEQKPGSDIDVCIRLKQPTFFNMTGIQEDLEGIFSCKVDLVSLNKQAWMFGKNTLQQGFFPHVFNHDSCLAATNPTTYHGQRHSERMFIVADPAGEIEYTDNTVRWLHELGI